MNLEFIATTSVYLVLFIMLCLPTQTKFIDGTNMFVCMQIQNLYIFYKENGVKS